METDPEADLDARARTPEAAHDRLDELEESLKEREHSVLRAIKTLFEDTAAYRRGEGPPPHAAMLGLVFAYLRPRLVIFVAGILGVTLAGVQTWVLVQQNRLIEKQEQVMRDQTERMDAQTRAAELQAVSFMLASLDPDDPEATEVAVAQLAEFGRSGRSVLLRLARGGTRLAPFASVAYLQQELDDSPEALLTAVVDGSDLYTASLVRSLGTDDQEGWDVSREYGRFLQRIEGRLRGLGGEGHSAVVDSLDGPFRPFFSPFRPEDHVFTHDGEEFTETSLRQAVSALKAVTWLSVLRDGFVADTLREGEGGRRFDILGLCRTLSGAEVLAEPVGMDLLDQAARDIRRLRDQRSDSSRFPFSEPLLDDEAQMKTRVERIADANC